MPFVEIKVQKPERVELVPSCGDGIIDGWVVGVMKEIGMWDRNEIPWVNLPENCFLQFANLPGDEREFGDFILKFGPLRLDRTPPRESKRAMKLWDSLESENMWRFATPTAHVAAEKGMLNLALEFWKLLSEGKFKEARDPFRRSTIKAIQQSDPLGWLEGVLTAHLQEAKVRVNLTKKGRSVEIDSALAFDALEPGIWIQFWQHIGGALKLAQCAKCSGWINRVRHGKRYCSVSCQQADKQRRYRERLGKKAKKKKGR